MQLSSAKDLLSSAAAAVDLSLGDLVTILALLRNRSYEISHFTAVHMVH